MQNRGELCGENSRHKKRRPRAATAILLAALQNVPSHWFISVFIGTLAAPPVRLEQVKTCGTGCGFAKAMGESENEG
jgi:hypothetical protein